MLTNKAKLLQDGVNVIGYFQGQFGLGESGRLLVTALKSCSIPYSLISADCIVANHTGEPYPEAFEEKGRYAINIFCIDILYLLPLIDKYGIQIVKEHYNIVLFFWETNIVPEDRLKLLAYFDEIWVATRYNLESLSLVVPVPVCHIPHPLQLNYSPGIPCKTSFGLDDRFTFLFCFDFFSNFQRKNPLAIIKAFQKAFPQRNDVQLVIKSHNGQHYPDLLNPALEDIKSDSRITWLDETMDQKRRYDLINACDCYVSLHRSEGFGLTMAEAMLMGKPVIATGYSGNLDFMTHENSFLCGYKLEPIGANNQHYSFNGVWADVNVDEAAFWMEFVVNNDVEAKAKAGKAKEDLLRNHSSIAVGTFITKRLAKILSQWDGKELRLRKRKIHARHLIDRYKHQLVALYMRYRAGVLRRLKKIGIHYASK